jgi:MoxR-like ATPase/CTP:molybdopterin cytidylyltransferase MocA
MEAALDASQRAGTPPVGVLLAAGGGRRMGQPKALVRDPDGTSWLNRAVDAVAEGGCEPVVVVLGAEADQAAGILAERDWPGGRTVRWVEAVDWPEGMGASLRRGLDAAQDTDAATAVVSLVDLPDVGPDVVERVVAAVGDDPHGLGRAAYQGVPGHPVVLGRDHWSDVAADAVGDRGAREYLATHGVLLVECGDLASGLDLDAPPAAPDQPGGGDDRGMQRNVESAADLAERLGRTGYLVDDALATVGYLALALGRPLLLEGEPGTGKTALAEAIAESLDVPLIRLQCYEGIDASQALYDWDFPRQILHLRAVEAAASGRGSATQEVSELEKSLFDERFLLSRPVLRALREAPAVLLVDEIDRADDEFEAFLLEVLSTYQVTIPEIGTVRAAQPPIVVLTSNRTRELHDALKRRCLYHWIDHPGLERELAIVRSRAPQVQPALAEQVVRLTQRLRQRDDLVKPPGVAETLDWARALEALGAADLDIELAAATLGVAVKYREDADRVRASLEQMLRA